MLKISIIVAFVLVAIQFIKVDTAPHVVSQLHNQKINAPQEVITILKKSCYDCHSNESVLPWYGYVAPMSWAVGNHINDGRKVLNFSTFYALPKAKQKEMFERIEQSIVIRMPLPSYTWIHRDAVLTPQEKKLLQRWSKEEFKKLR